MVSKNIDWLQEEELKTPIHDEMVLWTFNNAENIISKFNITIKYLKDYSEEDIKTFPERDTQFNNKKIIEFPLKGYNGFNLGYLDLVFIFHIEKHGYFPYEHNEHDDKNRIIGFEIKPEVKSIGEVLRQFQYYKSNLPITSKLILVTKTKGLKEIFESQGFYVYEYKEAVKKEDDNQTTS